MHIYVYVNVYTHIYVLCMACDIVVNTANCNGMPTTAIVVRIYMYIYTYMYIYMYMYMYIYIYTDLYSVWGVRYCRRRH